MFTLAERAKARRDELKLKQKEIAKACGITQQAYNDIEAGRSKRPRNLLKLAEVLKTTTEWLMYGKGIPPHMVNGIEIPEAHCPIIPWGKVMDWLSGNRDEAIAEMQGTIPSLNASHNSYALRIETPSMLSDESEKPSFRVGTIIIVEPEKKPKTGSFVIVSIDGKEPVLRQYMKEGSDRMITRMSTGHDIQYLSDTDKILGVVVAHIDLMD